jgi:hypothetical protein
MIYLISHKTLSAFYDSLDFDYDRGICVSVKLQEDVVISYYGRTILIKAGFKWDGSSMPGFKRWKINSPFDYLIASLVHDYLYIYQPTWASRKYADKAYRRLMIFEGAPRLQAYGRATALWFAGWVAWNKNKKRRK